MKFPRISYSIIVCSLIALAHLTPVRGAVSIIHTQNSGTAGEFLSSAGAALTTGGLTIGYFSLAIPDAAAWDVFRATTNIAAAYTALTNPAGPYRFVDVRSFPNITDASDWNYPTISGSVGNIATSNLPTGSQLFIMAFNQGTIANGFQFADAWAVVTATLWTAPADLASRSLVLSQVNQASDVKIGTDNPSDNSGRDIRLATVPEPTSAILLSCGLFGLLSLRRRNSHA